METYPSQSSPTSFADEPKYLYLLPYRAHDSWSFSNLATMVRLNLFTYQELLLWLSSPFGPPPVPDESAQVVQLSFAFPGFGQPQNV